MTSFTSADLGDVGRSVLDAWRQGADGDWSAPAGTLEWSCLDAADHTVDSVLAVGLFLASRRQASYPEWGWGELRLGQAATPERLVEALGAAVRVLVGVVESAEPGAAAVNWRRPAPQVRPAADFPARGALELVLHGHDVCARLGVPFQPGATACERLREHTRGWPH